MTSLDHMAGGARVEPEPHSGNRTLMAVPMHGEAKLRREGLRTRDAHLLEWFDRLRPDLSIRVQSRPEPWPRVTLARRRGRPLPARWQIDSPQPLTLPVMRDARDWWVRSLRYEPSWPAGLDGAIVWNPLAGARSLDGPRPKRLVFDLLDDWLRHAAFARLHDAVLDAYTRLFEAADAVTANSEGTLELARRFGRDDAILMPNGCDPERFPTEVEPHDRLTIGYGGKIGFRIDTGLVARVAARMPDAIFEFAGPVLVKTSGKELARIPNVRLLGDVHYADYPALFKRWDVAWAPHALGRHEVGGDLIKLYEYRAAGIPTVSTRVIGWERLDPGVRTAGDREVLDALQAIISGRGPGEVPREPYDVPEEYTWRAKAARLLELLEV